MRYSDNMDILLASIIYLGTHEYYWARSAESMATELSLDPSRLENVFKNFPGIFRKTIPSDDNTKIYYALQARYAQREGPDTKDPAKYSDIKVLDKDRLQLLINFISQAAESERAARRAWTVVIASIITAMAAILVAFIKLALP